MTGALTSIVIPTGGRRATLDRAVASALECGNRQDFPIEVIVVYNGLCAKEGVLPPHAGPDARVKTSLVPVANANAARNRGIELARGKYIRFLDDDDELLAPGFHEQVSLAERTAADICSSPIELVDKHGHGFGVAIQPETPDFVAASMFSHRMLQCTAHLFRTDLVRGIHWNESLSFSQDIEWVLRICQAREPRWTKGDVPCGIWSRHTGRRTSTAAPLAQRKKIIAEGILSLAASLESTRRLTDHRRTAAASGLWDCTRSSLAFDPRYWSQVAAAANRISPGSSPPGAIHQSVLTALGLSHLAIERALIPKRLLDHAGKRVALALGLLPHW